MTSRERLGQILIRAGSDPESIAQALAQQLKLSFAPSPLTPEREALSLLDRQVAVRLRVVSALS